MACCIIAAFILAQIMETLRRWGVFWGVVRPLEGEAADTLYHRARAWFARPRVRAAVMAVVVVELAALGSWVYVAHRTHLYRLADQTAGSLRGQTIVYAGTCDRTGQERVTRIVLQDGHVMARNTAAVGAL
ncbi:MAG: hypothetical protein V4579_06400 [Pseudomonadota bacterium]